MGNASSLNHHLDTAEKTGVITLSKSNLRDIPKDLQRIAHLLRTLDLNTNRLQQINDSIGTFKNLKILNLSHNRIKCITGAIEQLEKLETLKIKDNHLEGLPDELKNLRSLKVLALDSNKFTKFPLQTCELENLELLDLSNNEIAALPNQISRCQASEINLNNNKIRTLNEKLAECPNLKILRLDSNQIELSSITRPILADSKICLLCLDNNPFTLKQLQDRDGYEEYSSRYTSTKRKMV